VTIDPDVLRDLSAARRTNLSATVNDALRLTVALDRQRAAVAQYEREHGEIRDEELAPFLELALRAQARAAVKGARAAS
jgi:hypothetical protein